MSARSTVLRCLSLSLLLGAAACGRPAPDTADAGAGSATQCRIGPDGGPLPDTRVAERGIGGTGGFAPVPATSGPAALPVPERPIPSTSNGIGGTGLAGTNPPPSLGVVGIITGFGSVCLAGYEIGISRVAAIADDGRAASLSSLRAGQLAVLAAGPGPRGLEADMLGIRHEVVGPIETLASDRFIVVAGQDVTPASHATLARDLAPGDWVAVSGLRRPDGTIVATRIDPAPIGPVLLRGRLGRDPSGHPAIGPTRLIGTQTTLAVGTPVAVSGAYAANGIRVGSLARDVLAADPGAYFPPTVSRIAIERFVPAPTGGPEHDVVTLGRSASGGFGTIGRAPAPFLAGLPAFLPAATNAPIVPAPRLLGSGSPPPALGPAPTSRAPSPGGPSLRGGPSGGQPPADGARTGGSGPGFRGPPPH